MSLYFNKFGQASRRKLKICILDINKTKRFCFQIKNNFFFFAIFASKKKSLGFFRCVIIILGEKKKKKHI
jgi:hypothetical protein